MDGDRLNLHYRCDGSDCSVDYRVEIPPGLAATLNSGSGTLTLRDLSGEVTAVSGSGDIDASGLRARRFRAEAGSGDVEAGFKETPDHVEVETGSGEATAYLPGGKYDVTLETGSGDKTVQVTDDPSSPRKITLRTGSGDAGVLLS